MTDILLEFLIIPSVWC